MKILDQVWENVERERKDSDSAYFLSLTYLGELVAKLSMIGLLAAVADDRNNTRYGQLYKLVRATGIGDWAQVLDSTLTAPPAQFLHSAAYTEQTELLQRVGKESWQFTAIEGLHNALQTIGQAPEPLPDRVQGKQFFHAFATLRNKSRGHGAISPSKMGTLCIELHRSLETFCINFSLFQRSWAYIYRNLSGKFRVDELADSCECFPICEPAENSILRTVFTLVLVIIFAKLICSIRMPACRIFL